MDISKIIKPQLVSVPIFEDERGTFTKLINTDQLMSSNIVIHDINIVDTKSLGTFRGFHWQDSPNEEYKILRCLTGSILDLCVDIRDAKLKIYAFDMSEIDKMILIVPPFFAHGYLSLTNDVSVVYATTAPYSPQSEKGIRWNDPAIDWQFPIPNLVSKKDQHWPDWQLL